MNDVAVLAAEVRKAVRTAAKAGDLDVPAGVTFSVVSEIFAGGSAIDIKIKGADMSWYLTTRESNCGGPVVALTPEVMAIGDQLVGIFHAASGVECNSWRSVYVDGIIVESLGRAGWTPGMD